MEGNDESNTPPPARRKKGRPIDPNGRHLPVNVSLPEKILEQLYVIRDDTGTSVSTLVAQAVKAWLSKASD